MSVIAFLGDHTTTTCLALASAWPDGHEVVILEADRSGGSLAAWLGGPPTPSLSTIVASTDRQLSWSSLDEMIQRRSGIAFIAAPVRSREADRAIREASANLVPMLVAGPGPTVLADVGSYHANDPVPAIVSVASALVVCHRQDASSAGAATVRLERLAELLGDLSSVGPPIDVVVIGDRPFDTDEIGSFVSDVGRLETTVHFLPFDDLAAAVFAGRAGVSRRRLSRLPLVRHARKVAASFCPADPHASDRSALQHDLLGEVAPR